MTTAEFWLIGGMALATLLCRYPAMLLASRLEFPPLFLRTLDYVGPAVLAAVIALEITAPDPVAGHTLYQNPRFWAALVAGAVAWRTHHVWLTVAAGIATIALFRTFIG